MDLYKIRKSPDSANESGLFLLNCYKINVSICQRQKDMMFGRMVIDCLIAFARVNMHHHFHQGGQFVEKAVTHFFDNEVTLQGGQQAIHGGVHFTV